MRNLLGIVFAILFVSCVSTAQLTAIRTQIRDIVRTGDGYVDKLEEVDAVIEGFVDEAEANAWSNTEMAIAAFGMLTGTGVLTGKATSMIRDRKRKLRNEPTGIPVRRADPPSPHADAS